MGSSSFLLIHAYWLNFCYSKIFPATPGRSGMSVTRTAIVASQKRLDKVRARRAHNANEAWSIFMPQMYQLVHCYSVSAINICFCNTSCNIPLAPLFNPATCYRFVIHNTSTIPSITCIRSELASTSRKEMRPSHKSWECWGSLFWEFDISDHL